MPKVSRTITTEAPIDEVFAYMADFSNGPEWDPTQESSVAREDGGPRLGQVYDIVVRWGDREVPMVYEVTAYKPNHMITLVGDGSATHAVDTLEFAEVSDGGTAVTYNADIRLKGLLRLAEPFLGSKFNELFDDAEAGISKQLSKLAAGEIG